ncbi:hypothetical protein SK128_023848 [Halocaridina rubra]|uniref:C2H2-type domain-containing protein n=1 Tax=Halocaridina rubra TaxID=373956 RepID=A0AAN8XHJ9_HALRR
MNNYSICLSKIVILHFQSSLQDGPVCEEGNGKDSYRKIYRCSMCPYSSLNRVNKDHHMLVHTGEKPHKCPYCPASFAQKGNMNTHIRRHTGEKPYACPQCSYRATHKASLNNHMINHHKDYN